ncbi:MAG TPA: glycosyltransferase family 2 protein [Streptosporangiaceae bacterium]|nr:glycosyltransferase family 2 protein [Streptosporangiaceae bacterium]
MLTDPTEDMAGQEEMAADERSGARLSVVIVTYRNEAEIAGCLAAVLAGAPGIPTEVIVVDNASDDNTTRVARSAASAAKIIERAVNGGFGDGCRVGASVANGHWLLFLNPDAIIGARTIEELLACARRQTSAGIIGGRFVHEDGTDDPRSWWGRLSFWSALCFALGLNSLFPANAIFDPESSRPWSGDSDEERAVPVVSGALMLVRRTVWDQLDGFDPVFFLYGEDADFCMRAAALGWRPRVTARAVCLHLGGRSSSSNMKMLMLFKGKCTIVRRHFPRGLRGVGINLLVTGVFIRAAAGQVLGAASAARQGRPTTRAEDWRFLWTARDQWRRGWV